MVVIPVVGEVNGKFGEKVAGEAEVYFEKKKGNNFVPAYFTKKTGYININNLAWV